MPLAWAEFGDDQMSWLGESPTDTENSDCDEAQAAARARSPTGRHFHVWEVGGKTAKRGGDRPRREARKERKGRVVQQFRRAVYEHQHAEELAKRKVVNTVHRELWHLFDTSGVDGKSLLICWGGRCD